MTKKALYLLGILLTIIIGTILFYFLCCKTCSNKEKCKLKTNKEIVTTKVKEVTKVTKNKFAITDANGSFNFETNDNFNFVISTFSALEPISENVKNGVSKLKNYLLSNPLKTIDVLGFYKSDETNNSAFPNLGLARANSVKNYFVSLGIPSKQINTNGKLNDGINPDENNTLFGPLSFGVSTKRNEPRSYLSISASAS